MLIQVRKGRPGELELSFPYNENYIAKVKTIPGRKWDKEAKRWLIPDSDESMERLKKLFTEAELFFNMIIPNSDESSESEVYANTEQVLKMMKDSLKLRGYSPRTIKSYMSHAGLFLRFCGSCSYSITKKEIDRYLLHLMDEKENSHSFVSQAVSSIKFLFIHVYKQEDLVIDVIRPKKEKKLPEVLSQKEVLNVLDNVSNLKHKAILFLTYSSGLRVGEVVRLKVNDIDSDRMLIHVVQGKGRKDRYTVLSEVALKVLKEYASVAKPTKWLFPGEEPDSHITERTVQRVFENAKDRAGIQKKVSIHSLRHSFATHLLEGGIDLRYIQELLGHQNSKTTEIYTHVTQKSIKGIASPLDRLMGKFG